MLPAEVELIISCFCCIALQKATLDSVPPLTLESAQAAIRALIEEHDVPDGLMPTYHQLITAGQTDLKKGIVQLGGMRKVAASMNPQHLERHTSTVAAAAEGLQAYAQ